ncbi:MAG: ABC transporter permease [Candidatus Cyclobacteriaceae bacterium M3_2C_046]
MFKNYLLIAYRHLVKNRTATLINLLGLVLGMAVFLLIIAYANHETGYDKHFEYAESIYRVRQDSYTGGVFDGKTACGCPAVGPALKENYPEVLEYTMLSRHNTQAVIKYQNQALREDNFIWANQSFFKVFTYPLIKGNPDNALDGPNKIVLTKKSAEKYFGRQDPMGKIMNYRGMTNLEVTGLMDEVPDQTHLNFDFIVSFDTKRQLENHWWAENPWWWGTFCTYIRIKSGSDPEVLEAKIPSLVQAETGDFLKQINASLKYKLQPLEDIYLYSDALLEPGKTGEGDSVYFLLLLGFLIIIIAWINYINLSTAKAQERAREVGIRKANGASRIHLIFQFLAESLLINLLALILAIGLIQLTIPYFNFLTGSAISFDFQYNQQLFVLLGVFFIMGLLFSGFYPAYLLSSFKSISLKQSMERYQPQALNMRKVLVVFQFTTSIILIGGTLMISRQINFMQKQKLGADIEQSLVVKGPQIRTNNYLERYQSFVDQLSSYSEVKQVAAAEVVPGDEIWKISNIRLINQPVDKEKSFHSISVDVNYMDFLQLKPIAGGVYSEDLKTSWNELIFNETGIRKLGFQDPAQAIGQKVIFWEDTVRILGVIEDFHHNSLKQEIKPTVYYLHYPDEYFLIKLNTNDYQQVINQVSLVYQEYYQGNPFEYFFLDQHFDQQYQSDRRFSKIVSFFMGLAILIGCLGLFGLVAFSLVKRSKEIGIRKVLGASLAQIWLILSKDFIQLILVSCIIAVPVSFGLIKTWLQNFAFQTSINWILLMVIPVLSVLMISLMIISQQTLKAARANPVDALRSE